MKNQNHNQTAAATGQNSGESGAPVGAQSTPTAAAAILRQLKLHGRAIYADHILVAQIFTEGDKADSGCAAFLDDAHCLENDVEGEAYAQLLASAPALHAALATVAPSLPACECEDSPLPCHRCLANRALALAGGAPAAAAAPKEPTMDERLAAFGREVLLILEKETDWSSDTTDDIANLAIGSDLANTDDDGYFRSLAGKDGAL